MTEQDIAASLEQSPPTEARPADQNWARPVDRLWVDSLQPGAVNLNVHSRQLTGPLKGFGQMWQKTYRIRLSGVQVTPQQVVKVWKENFPKFWLEGNYFYGPQTGIAPGEVAVLNLAGPYNLRAPGDAPVISTGILVIYADDESFSFMTPEGHMFAGFNTFSAFEADGCTVVQIQALIRANDPIYEIGMRLGVIDKTEDNFWHADLKNLAAHFGVDGVVQQSNSLVDPGVQWKYARNIWHNAAIRTAGYYLLAPFRWLGGLSKGK
ncbi:MAG: hypothetical protein MUC85_14015 [Anaerolineales bacterium]|nr:hypothetical protein [Anaerolineales bacterium]